MDTPQVVLVVDDRRIYPKTVLGLHVIYARTSAEAIGFCTNNWDLVARLFLDNDLGGEDTVLPFLDFIHERVFLDEFQVGERIVHIVSDNPRGRQDIETWAERVGFPIERNTPPVSGWLP